MSEPLAVGMPHRQGRPRAAEALAEEQVLPSPPGTNAIRTGLRNIIERILVFQNLALGSILLTWPTLIKIAMGGRGNLLGPAVIKMQTSPTWRSIK